MDKKMQAGALAAATLVILLGFCSCMFKLRVCRTMAAFSGLRILARVFCSPGLVYAFFTIGFSMVLIMVVEALFAHAFFMDTFPATFGSFEGSFGSVFLVTSLSGAAIKDLLIQNWLATVFFALFLLVKMAFLSVGNCIMLQSILSNGPVFGAANFRQTLILMKRLFCASMLQLMYTGLGLLTIMFVETTLAHFLFLDESPANFGSLEASIASVFLVTTLSTVAVQDLFLQNWLATLFFASFLLFKMLFYVFSNSLMLKNVMVCVSENVGPGRPDDAEPVTLGQSANAQPAEVDQH